MEFEPTFRFDHGAECVEKPPMAVEFLLVLLFETEDDLNGTSVTGSLPGRCAEYAGGVLEDVRGDGLAIHCVFSDALLVTAHLRDESGTGCDSIGIFGRTRVRT